MDDNLAEVKAIWKALQMFVASRWAPIKVILESDSTNTIKWVLVLSFAWNLRFIIIQIEYFKATINSWEIVKIPRSANDVADSLAKAEV
ncbi:hypothetical protein POUND7_005917 [Theobroma cacao]